MNGLGILAGLAAIVAELVCAIMLSVVSLTAKLAPSFLVVMTALIAGVALTALPFVVAYLAEQEHLRFIAKLTSLRDSNDEAIGNAIAMAFLSICSWVVPIVSLATAIYCWRFK